MFWLLWQILTEPCTGRTSPRLSGPPLSFLLFRLSNPKDDRTKVNVSISLKFYKELQKHGAEGVLKREYGDMLVAPEDGFDATVQVDLSNIPEDWEEMVKKCGRLKRNCFASVFEKYFEFQVCPGGFLETSYHHVILH